MTGTTRSVSQSSIIVSRRGSDPCADQREDRALAMVEQLLDQMSSDEAGGARHEVRHGATLLAAIGVVPRRLQWVQRTWCGGRIGKPASSTGRQRRRLQPAIGREHQASWISRAYDASWRARTRVVSRQQLLRSGCRPHDLERLLRRRDLTRLLPGVFVDHDRQPDMAAASLVRRAVSTSPRPWWARRRCVLPSVQHQAGETRRGCSSAWTRTGTSRRLPGSSSYECSRFADRVLWNTSPPRQRTEDAHLDLAGSSRDELSAVQVLCRCGPRAPYNARPTDRCSVRTPPTGASRLARGGARRPVRGNLLGSRARVSRSGRTSPRPRASSSAADGERGWRHRHTRRPLRELRRDRRAERPVLP